MSLFRELKPNSKERNCLPRSWQVTISYFVLGRLSQSVPVASLESLLAVTFTRRLGAVDNLNPVEVAFADQKNSASIREVYNRTQVSSYLSIRCLGETTGSIRLNSPLAKFDRVSLSFKFALSLALYILFKSFFTLLCLGQQTIKKLRQLSNFAIVGGCYLR